MTFEILPGFVSPRFHETALSLRHSEENSTLGGAVLILEANNSLPE